LLDKLKKLLYLGFGAKYNLFLLARETKEEKNSVPVWERDSKKQDWEGTLDEYSEMVVQYGYITIFASTFPIAPLLAVINNVVEIRTDALKLLTSYPRPRYRGAQNIGTWYYILEVLGIVAVMTNCALIGLSFEVIRNATGNDDYATLGIVVFMEHIIIVLKFGISYLIPDLPGWIVKKLAYEQYVKEETLKTILLKNHIKPVFDVADVEDSSEEEAVSPTEKKEDSKEDSSKSSKDSKDSSKRSSRSNSSSSEEKPKKLKKKDEKTSTVALVLEEEKKRD